MPTPPAQARGNASLVAAHDRRWRELDPLLQPPDPVSDAEPLLVVDGAAGQGLAHVQVSTASLDDEASLWGALRTHRLRFHVGGPDRIAVFGELLDAFDDHLASEVPSGDEETSALVVLPSRDVQLPDALWRRGFSATTVVAAHTSTGTPRSGRGPDAVAPATPVSTVPSAGSRVREAEADDLDALVEMAVDLHAFDATYGGVTARPTARAVLREALRSALDRDAPWIWLAEDLDGDPHGIVKVQPPADAGWIAPVTTVPEERVAYLAMLFVRPDRRAGGLGTRLVRTAHEALAAVGVEVTLLHHALPNPYSTPFWAQQGYRPLWTAWQRRPARRGDLSG